MALDDFDDLDDVPEPPAVVAPQGIDADDADGLEDPEDVDLFDFPEWASVDTIAAAPAASAAPAAPVAPVASAAPAAPSSPDPAGQNFDPDLDQDLFDFSEVFAGGDIVGEVRETAAEDDFVVPPALTPQTLVEPELPATAQEAFGSAFAAGDARPEAGRLPRALPPPPPVQLEPPPAKGRLIELLAVGFLLVNTALIVFAWRASESFHDTLTQVTQTVADTLTTQQASAQTSKAPVYLTYPSDGNPDQAPSSLEDLQIQSLRVARDLVEAEQYLDARQRLYLLLANRDLAPLDPAVAAGADFLIAESYERQGTALAENER